MKYFKVQKGYKEDDYISIDETELDKAIMAQITGKVVVFNEGSISGNHIMSIVPDWNKTMGWKRDYKLTGEDYDYIGSKKIEESRQMIKERLDRFLNQSNNLKLN